MPIITIDEYDGGTEFNRLAAELTGQALKDLLETKHLYQSVHLNFDGILADERICSLAAPKRSPNAHQVILSADWITEGSGYQFIQSSGCSLEPHTLSLESARLFCSVCSAREPHNTDSMNFLRPSSFDSGDLADQQLVIKMTCQGCRRADVSFLIEREGERLRIAGRSPMERVIVPDVIPPAKRSFFATALVAARSGQPLPAACMLRIFIEQHVREESGSWSPNVAGLDAAFAACANQIDPGIRDRFRSARSIYNELSCMIHAADATEGQFDQCHEDLTLLFEAIHLYGRAGITNNQRPADASASSKT